MNIREVLSKIDEIIPFALSESWDNTGLIIGDNDAPVSGVYLALDAAPEIIERAANLKCNLLVTHHPLIFNPISKLDTASFTGAAIKAALVNDMAVISLHTNWDKAGLNDALASMLNLSGVTTLQPQKDERDRMGVVGELAQAADAKDFVETVKHAWGLTYARYHPAAAETGKISRVAICGGAASEFWTDALRAKADVYITAEVKLHHRLAAAYGGLPIIEADHGEMESTSLPSLADILARIAGDVPLYCDVSDIITRTAPLIREGEIHE